MNADHVAGFRGVWLWLVKRGEGAGEKVCTVIELKTFQGEVKATEVCIAPARSENGRIMTYAYLKGK